MANLTGQQICTTYGKLLQIDGGQLQDGFGNPITSLGTNFSSSYALTASYIDVTGSGVLVNWFGSQLQLTASSVGGGVTVNNVAPTSPIQGDLWWDTDDANMYMYYEYVTGSSSASAWVPATSLAVQALSADSAITASYALTAAVAQTSSYYIMSNYITNEYVDDAAAAAGGIPLGGIYRSGNVVVVRIV